jgi:hypothetical protein
VATDLRAVLAQILADVSEARSQNRIRDLDELYELLARVTSVIGSVAQPEPHRAAPVRQLAHLDDFLQYLKSIESFLCVVGLHQSEARTYGDTPKMLLGACREQQAALRRLQERPAAELPIADYAPLGKHVLIATPTNEHHHGDLLTDVLMGGVLAVGPEVLGHHSGDVVLFLRASAISLGHWLEDGLARELVIVHVENLLARREPPRLPAAPSAG